MFSFVVGQEARAHAVRRVVPARCAASMARACEARVGVLRRSLRQSEAYGQRPHGLRRRLLTTLLELAEGDAAAWRAAAERSPSSAGRPA